LQLRSETRKVDAADSSLKGWFLAQKRSWFRRCSALAIAVILALLTPPARAQSNGGAALWTLAEALCGYGDPDEFRGGFLPLMGFAAKAHSMRRFRQTDPIRYLMIPAEHCRDRLPVAKNAIPLILWHIRRPGEGRYYLASTNGQLLTAIDGIAATKANYMLADSKDPELLADFNDEKRFWLQQLANRP
jgi:hypothetical protein